jgi:hypothetical protein
MAYVGSPLEAVRRTRHGRRWIVRLKRHNGPVMAEGEFPLDVVRRPVMTEGESLRVALRRVCCGWK